MKLSNMLSKGSILQIERATDKWDVIRNMLHRLDQQPFVMELDPALRESLFNEIEKREALGNTGLGEGIAFPHARIDGLSRPLIAFATVRDGVDFGAPDGTAANIVFLCLLPARRAELGVKINSVFSRFLMQPNIHQSLMDATDADEILSIIAQNTAEIDAPIIALDLMRAERLRLTPDLAGNEATQLMHRARTVAAPVVDEAGSVIGEVNCNTLFQRELPDYIKKLHSVPRLTDFRAFEHYFTEDAKLTVADLMNECSSIVEEDASLLEILFLLSVKKHPLLYVCQDSKLIGVIDPITVLDRVLNL